MTLTCHVEAIGFAAPGLPDWSSARDVLAGRAAWVSVPDTPYSPQLLPPNERRRATPSVRQAFRAAEDAMKASTLAFAELPSVFASSDADLGVLDRLCTALAREPRLVSPTDFHNSVHNAASGYWSIAIRSREATTTIAAFDGSFAAGLLEAAAMLDASRPAVLLVAYDVPAPAPLHAKRALVGPASVALVLTRHRAANAQATLVLEPAAAPVTPSLVAALETLRTGNAAMRAVPLLEHVARGTVARVTLPGASGTHVAVEIAP